MNDEREDAGEAVLGFLFCGALLGLILIAVYWRG